MIDAFQRHPLGWSEMSRGWLKPAPLPIDGQIAKMRRENAALRESRDQLAEQLSDMNARLAILERLIAGECDGA